MGRDAAVLLAGRVLQALLNIAALRLMTHFLSPGQVGSMFLILSFVTGFAFFLVSPMGMYINRRLHSWQSSGKLMSRFWVFNAYVLLVSSGAIFVSLFAKSVMGVGPTLSSWPFALIVASYLYFNTWNMTLVPALNMLGYRILFVVFSVLTTGLGLVFSLLAVTHISASAFSWLSGQISAIFLVSLIALFSLSKRTGESFRGWLSPLRDLNKGVANSVAAFSVPLAGATLFMWLQNQGYRLIVELKAGAEFLGYLAVGVGIAASLAAVSETLVQQIYAPGFYKRISAGGAEERKLALSAFSEKTIPVYVILLFFTFSLSPQLTGLLADPKFQSAAKFVAFGAVIEFFRMSANVISSAAHSEMRTAMLVRPYVLGSLITCGGVYAASTTAYLEILIPSAMIAGVGATFWFMRREVVREVPFSINRQLIMKTAFYSAPFLFFIPLRAPASPLWALGMLAVAGLYFVGLQYLVAFKWTQAWPTAASPGRDQAAPAATVS